MKGNGTMDITAQIAQAKQYFENKEYKKALPLYQALADNGNHKARSTLGWMYLDGLGVDKDYKRAFDLFMLAKVDDSDAVNRLGYMYENGLHQNGWSVKQDYAKAFRLYSQAAKAGNSEGMNNLGWLYDQGLGVRTNLPKALKLYKKAIAVHNNLDAMDAMGCLYRDGRGVKKNYQTAKKLFLSAAAKGGDYAQYDLGCMYRDGQGAPQDLQQAAYYFSLAADQGDEDAKSALADLKEKATVSC
jgi:uncharacterized protein